MKNILFSTLFSYFFATVLSNRPLLHSHTNTSQAANDSQPSLCPFTPPLNIISFPRHLIISPPIYPSFIFPLFRQSNLPFAALHHHSPALFLPSSLPFLLRAYCFKLTSADWPATPITCYIQQKALTHRVNQCVCMHNNISFIFRSGFSENSL